MTNITKGAQRPFFKDKFLNFLTRGCNSLEIKNNKKKKKGLDMVLLQPKRWHFMSINVCMNTGQRVSCVCCNIGKKGGLYIDPRAQLRRLKEDLTGAEESDEDTGGLCLIALWP
ncbi:hypothetical protein INR49_005604 [Caranx melampygus]|nr:hypothetical protein INR49_005604 [Caranx melampygus]